MSPESLRKRFGRACEPARRSGFTRISRSGSPNVLSANLRQRCSPLTPMMGSSCLSRRNMILGGAAVVAAISLPKNSLASTPLSTTDQPSKNNDGNDDNMNSTTDIPETAHTFDPSNFTVVPARTFEDLHVGEIFRAPSRTLTDAHASAFQAVSADNHPIHYDVEYARRHGHTAPVVHGLQVLAFTAPGATLFPQYIGDAFIAFTEASCKFLKEVHAGDTLYSALEIVALTPREIAAR